MKFVKIKMGTSKANSAKKDQKSNKKSGKTAQKNDKVTKKSTKSSNKLAKASGKAIKTNSKNQKKAGTKKSGKKASKNSKKNNKLKGTKKGSKSSGKCVKKNCGSKTAKGNQKADNLVFLWFLWASIIIVLFLVIYFSITALSSTRNPTYVSKNNEVLVIDARGNKVIGALPIRLPPQSISSAPIQLTPTTSGSPRRFGKTPVLPICDRTCYEPANIFLLPPNFA